MSYKVGDMVMLHTGLEDGKMDGVCSSRNQMIFCGMKKIKQIEYSTRGKFYILDGVPGYKFPESMLEPCGGEGGMKYKDGDKVRLRNGLLAGSKYGGIRFLEAMRFDGVQYVEKAVPSGGKIRYQLPSGYYYSEEMLEPAEEKKPPKRLISIVVDGNKVTAIEGHLKGVARCSPEDNFNLAEGMKLAVERLENPWPRNGDLGYVMGYVFGELVAVKTAYNDSSRAHKMQKKKKLFFRTKKQAQAFIERLEDFIKRDRGLE